MHCALNILSFFGVTAACWTEKYNPDLELSAPQIISRHGYPSQAHSVVSEDGYILSLHRIPHGRNNTGKPRKPILLHHGIGTSSADFLLTGPDKSLAYLLADDGYDVWLGNNRGNYYSDGHVTLSNDDPKYWDFTWHEMGYYDLPAIIDYILEKVNEPSLYYVGHSMGTSIYFVMASTRPEYGLKVKAMIALAPVAYCSHAKSPLKFFLSPAHEFQVLAMNFLKGAMKPNKGLMAFYAKHGNHMTIAEKIAISNVMFTIFGFDRPQLNMTLLPLMVSHHPTETSTKQWIHFSQLAHSGKFQRYDYGKKENLKRYGQPDPPEYNLTKIQTPVALFHSDNDWLSAMVDVDRLYQELPRKIGKFLVNYKGFNHIDFLFGIDSKPLLYDHLINLLKTL